MLFVDGITPAIAGRLIPATASKWALSAPGMPYEPRASRNSHPCCHGRSHIALPVGMHFLSLWKRRAAKCSGASATAAYRRPSHRGPSHAKDGRFGSASRPTANDGIHATRGRRCGPRRATNHRKAWIPIFARRSSPRHKLGLSGRRLQVGNFPLSGRADAHLQSAQL